MSNDWHDDENHDARLAFGELDLRDRLAAALLDESGLRPTNAALEVLMVVVAALDEVDEWWSNDNAELPPTPTVVHYVPTVGKRLGEMWLTWTP